MLEQLFLDAAMKAGSQEDARLLLERVAGRHPVPPDRRVGYAEAARAMGRREDGVQPGPAREVYATLRRSVTDGLYEHLAPRLRALAALRRG